MTGYSRLHKFSVIPPGLGNELCIRVPGSLDTASGSVQVEVPMFQRTGHQALYHPSTPPADTIKSCQEEKPLRVCRKRLREDSALWVGATARQGLWMGLEKQPLSQQQGTQL